MFYSPIVLKRKGIYVYVILRSNLHLFEEILCFVWLLRKLLLFVQLYCMLCICIDIGTICSLCGNNKLVRYEVLVELK